MTHRSRMSGLHLINISAPLAWRPDRILLSIDVNVNVNVQNEHGQSDGDGNDVIFRVLVCHGAILLAIFKSRTDTEGTYFI